MIAYLSLGSNLGNRQQQLITASALLAERAGDILALSGFYETAPWGFESEHAFLNAALKLETALTPSELLSVTQQIERELGRPSRKEKTSYQDRTIDIDILLYDTIIQENPELILPHPLMHRRRFILEPLVEIAPLLYHPALNRTMTELLHLMIP
jgi:2-amino-4-hydroxy-6-hydroxymethyldihydropteridine diphosphokinase